MNWAALPMTVICLFGVVFPARSARLVERFMKFTYLRFLLRLLRLQGIEPDVEKLERMFTIRKIYVQAFGVIFGSMALYSLFFPVFH